MASLELKKYVDDLQNYIRKTDKVDYSVIDALYQASNVAIMTEKDSEFGLSVTAKAKELLSKYIMQETHGEHNLWSVENICAKQEQDTKEIELYYNILLEESLYNLQSYMYFLERHRKPESRFYFPRRKTLKVVVNDLTRLENREFSFYGLSMPPRVGKLLSNGTPILTKDGWKNHGDLVVGDYVLGRDMEWVKVTHIHPKNFANKRVWFADNTYIDCHENHEWLVYDRSRNCERIVETKELERCDKRFSLPSSSFDNDYCEIGDIAIERVEDIEPTEGNCITVEGGLYRVGRTLKLTHNSTTCIMFLTWIMLKRPNAHNAMGGHSGELAKGFFKESLNVLTSSEYTFREMYEFWHPHSAMIRDKSAESYTITLDKPDRFASLVCRGCDATWTGAVDVSSDGYLYVDDLIKDREQSLSPQRMEDTYQKYLNVMTDRKNDGARELMVGTLWNVQDPLERERVKHEGDTDFFFRRLPALDDKMRSNFDYEIGGFSTKYYMNIRNRLDDPEWMAKYQQKPYVREGLLFPKDELRYFDGYLNDLDLDFRTVAVVDPAFGGGDSLSMPICRDYGDDHKYIVDWVFSNKTQKFTVPQIVKKIMQYGIVDLQVERNSAGVLMIDNIKDEMKAQGCNFCKITPVNAPVRMSKDDKIRGYSDFIRDNFIFLLPKDNKRFDAERFVRSQEYDKAMEELSMYSSEGKNVHDDAPDSMAQLAMFYEKRHNGEISIIHNPFRGMLR